MNFKLFREKNGLTQADMCRGIGVALPTYRGWESGIGNPSPENQEKLDAFVAKIEAESGVR